MRRRTFAAALVTLFTGAAVSVIAQPAAAPLESLVDKPLPQLPLTTVDGKPFNTASLQGKVLLLNFFAAW